MRLFLFIFLIFEYGDTGKKKNPASSREAVFQQVRMHEKKVRIQKKEVTVIAVHHEKRRIKNLIQCGMGVRLPYKNHQSTLCSNIAFYTKNDLIVDLLTSIINKCCIIIQFEFNFFYFLVL